MGISRRTFIKAGAATTAAIGLSGSLFSSKKWFQPVEAKGNSLEKTAFTYHTMDCGGRCAFKCTVRDGRLAMIQPNIWPDKRFSTVCLKGLSEIERIYSPDRLQTPLKRVGKRGEGKFVPISWNEALTTIAGKLKELKGQYGGKSILFNLSASVEYAYPFLPTLLGAQYAIGNGIDIGLANGLEECIGTENYGYIQNEPSDWVNSRTIIFLGCNILETTLTDSKFFYKAKESGAKIIVIDPNHSTTAAKSDQWIRIKPGTDSALLLGMISAILDNNWYDQDYLVKNTSAPFLVRADNQKLLRQNASEESVEKNPYLVWDENSNSLKPFNAPGVKAKLEGEFSAGGVKVKTVFAALKENQKPYTLKWAAGKTEIEENIILELTRDYATRGPAVLGWGFGGVDKWANSDITGHAGGILGALTGNIGRVGGGVGNALYHAASWSAELGTWELPSQFEAAEMEMTTPDFRDKPNSVKAIINIGNTLQQQFANLHKTENWLKQLELVVTIDPFHNPSVDYSDIVLPASTAFESEYEIVNLQINRSHVLLSQRIIEPLYQCKSDFQIEKELAAKLGLDQYLPKTPEEYQNARLNSQDPALKGINVKTLKENNFIMRLNAPEEPYRSFMDQVYPTPSTKLELYHEKVIEDHQALPNFEAPNEASKDNPLTKKYPLNFSSAHTRYRVHSQFTNARWINQYYPEPRVEMNPQDAKSRGLQNDDIVEVFNDRGKFRARLRFNEAYRPGQIRLHEGWWPKMMVAGNLQNVTNDYLNPRQYKLRYGPVIPYNDTLVEVKKV